MIDIEKAREALNEIITNEFYDMIEEIKLVEEALTELERLQKALNDIEASYEGVSNKTIKQILDEVLT
jgi:archaellum component FlaC